MKIILTDAAMQWFKEEMEVEQGDLIRFYARYGGTSPFHEGFSLGMNRETAHEIGVSSARDGVTFYIERADEWFFDEHDLIVEVNEQVQELIYRYVK